MSPGKNHLIKPPSLQELDKRLKNGSHRCLCQPVPHYKGCTAPFDVGNDEKRNTAIQEAKLQLADMLATDNLLQHHGFHEATSRLKRIAEAFCCPKHRTDPEKMQDFGYYWLGYELLDGFLDYHKWELDESTWKCSASIHGETCAKLKELLKDDRDMVYRAFVRLAVYTAFWESLGNSFLRAALASLVELWTCTEHRKCVANIEAKKTELEEVISRSCGSYRTSILSEQDFGRAPSVQLADNIPSTPGAFMVEPIRSSAASLSPDWGITNTHQKPASRRRSAPSALLSSYDQGPRTPNRPLPVRSAVSDTEARGRCTDVEELPLDFNNPNETPSRAPRIKSPLTPDRIRFHESNPMKEEPGQTVAAVLGVIKQEIKSGSDHDGWIYILQIPGHPDYVKIGRTRQNLRDRTRQISSCHNIKVVGGQHMTMIPFHERLERIIHADLYNERHFFHCPCTGSKSTTDSHKDDGLTKHGEWFKLSVEKAIYKVEQWKTWMGQEPYEKPGTCEDWYMKEYFKRRLQHCEKAGVPAGPEDPWKKFMTPFYMDCLS